MRIGISAVFYYTVRPVTASNSGRGRNPYNFPLEVLDGAGSLIGYCASEQDGEELALGNITDSAFIAQIFERK